MRDRVWPGVFGAAIITSSIPIGADEAFAEAEAAGALIVLSPGPGRPGDAGCCMDLVALAKGRVPLLGVCLGHQTIIEEAGGRIDRADAPVHGKASLLEHDGKGPFAGIEGRVRVGRYHSLCARDLPGRFSVHARIDGMAMAVSDPDALQTGLQFHPESVLTAQGDRMLANVLADAGGGGVDARRNSGSPRP